MHLCLRRLAFGLIGAGFLVPAISRAQFNIVLQHDADIDPRALDGFELAAQRWAGVLHDPITVTLNVGFDALPADELGATTPREAFVSYSDFHNALAADRSSWRDDSAVAALSAGPDFSLLINRTSDSPDGSGDARPFLDNNASANNSTLVLTQANERALGRFPARGTDVDADITFNSTYPFDFNPSDGIQAGEFDFVGIATHEIGHALGFLSGVDILDQYSGPRGGPFPTDAFLAVTPLDLFRFSKDSHADGAGVIDWTADRRPKYFSIDGGMTPLAWFSTGVDFGDGQQASHWADNDDFGIMDPTAAFGETLRLSQIDLTAFDVIGYDVAVPEPAEISSAAALSLALGCLLRLRHRKSRKRTV